MESLKTKVYGIVDSFFKMFDLVYFKSLVQKIAPSVLIDFENNEKEIAFGMKYRNLNKEETIEKIYEEFIKPKRKIKN